MKGFSKMKKDTVPAK